MVGLFCIQLAPMQLSRRMGAGLVIVYGLGLIHHLPFTVGYLYPLVSSMSSQTSVANGLRANPWSLTSSSPVKPPISPVLFIEPAKMASLLMIIFSAAGATYFILFISMYIMGYITLLLSSCRSGYRDRAADR